MVEVFWWWEVVLEDLARALEPLDGLVDEALVVRVRLDHELLGGRRDRAPARSPLGFGLVVGDDLLVGLRLLELTPDNPLT